MGLSATLGIIKSVSGALQIETEENVGTRFCVYIPEGSAKPAKEDSSSHLSLNVASGKVLVVDDEAGVRSVATSFLEELGYQTIEATNGQHAISVLKDNLTDIQFVLLDIQMPILDGPATLKLIREIDPTLGVILSSGYANQALSPAIQDEHLVFLCL